MELGKAMEKRSEERTGKERGAIERNGRASCRDVSWDLCERQDGEWPRGRRAATGIGPGIELVGTLVGAPRGLPSMNQHAR